MFANGATTDSATALAEDVDFAANTACSSYREKIPCAQTERQLTTSLSIDSQGSE